MRTIIVSLVVAVVTSGYWVYVVNGLEQKIVEQKTENNKLWVEIAQLEDEKGKLMDRLNVYGTEYSILKVTNDELRKTCDERETALKYIHADAKWAHRDAKTAREDADRFMKQAFDLAKANTELRLQLGLK